MNLRDLLKMVSKRNQTHSKENEKEGVKLEVLEGSDAIELTRKESIKEAEFEFGVDNIVTCEVPEAASIEIDTEFQVL
ncbi:hypothetical protein MHBO_004707 [Bonamia ostreae]|uniref:Uncharacterized protein n=1 Tax=Bonamia ostreae TaxID=126728 RepID=A0ABV2AU31_9EUKA